MSELPKIKQGQKTYYFDAHLKQLRNTKNPHDITELSDVECGLIKQTIGENEKCRCNTC